MRIGLISDTHNHQRNIKRALSRLRAEDVTTVLHAGDITSTQTLRLFSGFDLWIARGNMDHDPGLVPVSNELFGSGRLRSVHKLSLNGARVAMTHSGTTKTWRDLIESQDYDYVIYGHSHRPENDRVGSTRVLNPGALNNVRWRVPTFAILDLEADDVTLVEL
ncbi:MAG: metallophosphoesterase family protein [Anaerolineae bacterium]